jgi:hypothetical protein
MCYGSSVIIFSMKSMYVWLHLLGTELEPLHRAQERPVLEAVGCCVELLLPAFFRVSVRLRLDMWQDTCHCQKLAIDTSATCVANGTLVVALVRVCDVRRSRTASMLTCRWWCAAFFLCLVLFEHRRPSRCLSSFLRTWESLRSRRSSLHTASGFFLGGCTSSAWVALWV